MRELAVDSLEALTAALPPRMRRRYPALLTLPVWGSIIGGCAFGKAEECGVLLQLFAALIIPLKICPLTHPPTISTSHLLR